MITIPESEYVDKQWCPVGGKYLSPNAACVTEQAVRYEGNNEIRGLNPGCCSGAKYYYLWPIYTVGFWGLILITALAAAVACNVYLADTNEYLSARQQSLQFGRCRWSAPLDRIVHRLPDLLRSQG